MGDGIGTFFAGMGCAVLLLSMLIGPVHGCQADRCGEMCAKAGLNFHKRNDMDGCLCREKSAIVPLRSTEREGAN